MWIGIFLVCAGILLILDNMNIIRGDVWNYIVPLFLILLGISLLMKKGRTGKRPEPPVDNTGI